MPVEYKWYDEDNSIAICIMSGVWTWDEFYAMRQTFREETGATERERVDLIWEVTRDARVPDNFISTLKSAISTASANWNITVVVRPHPLVKALLDVVTKTQPEVSERYPYADTYEDAHALILRHRSDPKKPT